jgi:predicted dehydrogenase
MRAFAEAVEKGAEYEVSGQAALPALRLAAAVEQSVQSGAPVEL